MRLLCRRAVCLRSFFHRDVVVDSLLACHLVFVIAVNINITGGDLFKKLYFSFLNQNVGKKNITVRGFVDGGKTVVK